MSLRLVDILIPDTETGFTAELQERFDIIDAWHLQTDSRINLKFLLEADKTEPLLDFLETRFAACEGFRIAILPKLARTPGYTEWPGPELAEHRDQILAELGYDREQIAALQQNGDI